MYNLLLRESFEVRPVHGRRRTEGPLQHRRPKDSSRAESIARERASERGRALARARPGIHYPRVRFFTEVLLPSHLYCDKPFLHSDCRRRQCRAYPSRSGRVPPRVLASEESVCVSARCERTSPWNTRILLPLLRPYGDRVRTRALNVCFSDSQAGTMCCR